jgi:hypothetical protein
LLVRASGVAATEFERVTCSYRSKLARFLQQVSSLHLHEGLVKTTPYSKPYALAAGGDSS